MTLHCCTLLAATALSLATADAGALFDFEADNPGTTTGFTETVNGLTATFSSSADPGGFVIYSSIFSSLTGNVLGDPGPAQLDNLSLTVNFSQNLASIALNFATSDFTTPSPFTLNAYENNNLVGTVSATGNFINGFSFPEGTISFSGGVFNRIVFTSTATDFAVDNINAMAAPEPAGFALLGAGLTGLALPAIRRKKRAAASF